MAFNIIGNAGAGAGADMLQEILRRKADEYAQSENRRIAEETRRAAAMQQAAELQQRQTEFGETQSRLKESTAAQNEMTKQLRDQQAQTAFFQHKLPTLQKGFTLTPEEYKGSEFEKYTPQLFGEEMKGPDRPADFVGPDLPQATGKKIFKGTQQEATREADRALREELARLAASTQKDVADVRADVARTNAANTLAARGQLSGPQAIVQTRLMRQEYNRILAPAREMRSQLGLMEQGLDAARKGNLNAGSQAILVTFQKILDPTSVVRESEYERSAQGLALKQRIEGLLPRLIQGGPGVPISELEKFAELAREFTRGREESLKQYAAPILASAQDYGIDPARISGEERQDDRPGPPPATRAATGAGAGRGAAPGRGGGGAAKADPMGIR